MTALLRAKASAKGYRAVAWPTDPFGARPTTLEVTVHRRRCAGCVHVWRQDTGAAAPGRSRLSRGGPGRALEAAVVDHLTISRVAASSDATRDTADDAVPAEDALKRSGFCFVVRAVPRRVCDVSGVR